MSSSFYSVKTDGLNEEEANDRTTFLAYSNLLE